MPSQGRFLSQGPTAQIVFGGGSKRTALHKSFKTLLLSPDFRNNFAMIHFLFMCFGLDRLARATNSHPRFWGLIVSMAGTLGLGLQFLDLSTMGLSIGFMSYMFLLLVGLYLSPLQLLLPRSQRPKVETKIVVLAEGEGEVSVDIVAVHGLGSNPDWAWTYEKKDEGTKGTTKVMWLEDLLPKAFPRARIMTFNHDSGWIINASVKSPRECGQQLLDALNAQRWNLPDREKMRPIIFIGHSFGGQIIKEAIVRAGEDPRYKSLKSSTECVLFLGVPHDGSRLTFAGKIMSSGTYWLGSSTQLLGSLEPGSENLRILNDRFLSAYGNSKHLVNFCEAKVSDFLGIPIMLGVERHSSCFAGKANIIFDCNHIEMNKFGSERDGRYITEAYMTRTAIEI